MEWLNKNWGLKRVVSRVTKQYFNKTGRTALVHWPARSPDLSVLDYAIWAKVKELAWQEAKCPFYKDKEEAKECLKKAWAKIDQSYIVPDFNQTKNQRKLQVLVTICNRIW